MKRWIVVLLVVLAVVVLISPGIIGRIAEQDLEESISRAGVETPEITISTESFDRGWFSSAGRHRIELTDRQKFPQMARFAGSSGYERMPALVLESRIDHGIVPIGSVTNDEVTLSPGIANLVSTMQLDPGNGELVDLPGRISTTIGLSGETDATLLIEQGRWTDGGNSIEWQGADLQFTLDRWGDLTRLEGFVAPLNFRAGYDGFASERIDVSLNHSRSAYELMVGSVHLHSGAVAATGSFGSNFGYSSLTIDADNHIDDDRLSGSSSVDIADIGVPGVDAMDFGFDVSFEGLDARSFAALYAALEETVADGNPQNAFGAIYPSMDAEIQQFLSAGAQIRFDRLDIALPQGEIRSNMSFSLPPSGSSDAFSWPGVLLKLRASFSVQMPEAVFELAQSIQPEIGAAVAAGFLVKKGDTYKMDVEYAQGLATVNGMPVPVPMPGT